MLITNLHLICNVYRQKVGQYLNNIIPLQNPCSNSTDEALLFQVVEVDCVDL